MRNLNRKKSIVKFLKVVTQSQQTEEHDNNYYSESHGIFRQKILNKSEIIKKVKDALQAQSTSLKVDHRRLSIDGERSTGG